MSLRLKRISSLITESRDVGDRPFVALENVEAGTGRLTSSLTDVPVRSNGERGAITVERGDVLFGKLRPYLAKSWCVDAAIYASTELMALRPSPECDGKWLSYLVASKPAIEWAVATSEGTKMPRTSWEKFGYLMLATMPDLQSQRAIASYLDKETARIDALIEKKQRMVELLEERYDSFVDKLITYNSYGVERAVGRLIAMQITDGPHETPEFVDEGVPFLSIEAIKDNELDFEGCRFISRADHIAYSKKTSPRKDDVLLAKTGATIGKTALVRSAAVFSIWSPLALLRPKVSEIMPEFLWHCLRTKYVQKQIRLNATQNTQPNIAMGDISGLRIRVPPIEMQFELLNLLNCESVRIANLQTTLAAQTELLGERRMSVITAAVTGQLEIPSVAA